MKWCDKGMQNNICFISLILLLKDITHLKFYTCIRVGDSAEMVFVTVYSFMTEEACNSSSMTERIFRHVLFQLWLASLSCHLHKIG